MKDDKAEGCGISKIWITSENDHFHRACSWHDSAYLEGSEASKYLSRKETDHRFLVQMLGIAKNDPMLKAKAYFYYGLVRLFGGVFWEGLK